MKRSLEEPAAGDPMSRDDFVEVQRCGASAADPRTLEPARYFPGCWTTLAAAPRLSHRMCTSTFNIGASALRLTVDHYADADAAAADDDESLPDAQHDDETGLTLWPASFLLMDWLASRQNLAELSLLELGAGCGVAGLAAARLGANLTLITDGSEHAVKLAARNIEANKLDSSKASAKVLLWGQHQEEQLFDLVIACEVAHLETSVVDLLFETAVQHFKSDRSQFVVAYLARGPSRLGRKYGAAKLIASAAKCGLGAKLIQLGHLDNHLQPACHRAELISFERNVDAEASRKVGCFLDELGEKHLQELVREVPEAAAAEAVDVDGPCAEKVPRLMQVTRPNDAKTYHKMFASDEVPSVAAAGQPEPEPAGFTFSFN